MLLEQLRQEIKERKKNQKGILQAIDDYCRDAYGVPNFSEIIQEKFPDNSRFGLCLARQIPNANIEHLAHVIVADWVSKNGIPSQAVPMAFTRDCFSGRNPLKKSYVQIPFLKRGRKGLCSLVQEIVHPEQRGSLDGMILHAIKTTENTPITEYHLELRRQAGLEEVEVDLSDFFLQCLDYCLAGNGKKPEFVFVEEGEKEKRMSTKKLNGHKICRPPADWFYDLYLMLFVDGQRALLSTVDDDDNVSGWFRKAIQKIEKITGFLPLIIDTPKGVTTRNQTKSGEAAPNFSSELLEIPGWVFQITDWKTKIQTQNLASSVFEAMNLFEEKLIELS